MTRIDPLELLQCLKPLLDVNGGIQSSSDVSRLVGLMTKYSKNMVSKCIYILILKNTTTNLLGEFMQDRGWDLLHTWFTFSIQSENYALVSEILELMLMCPVDLEQLKRNNIALLVKSLSSQGPHGVRVLSAKLVEQWLLVVKNNTKEPKPQGETTTDIKLNAQLGHDDIVNEIVVNEMDKHTPNLPVYRIKVHDGKQILAKVERNDDDPLHDPLDVSADNVDGTIVATERLKKEDEKCERSKSRHSSSSRHSKSSSSSRHKSSHHDRDKRDKRHTDEKKHSHSSHRSSSSSSSSKDKHRSSSSSKSSHTSMKEKQKEKDNATLAQLMPQNISKLGRIPKKTSTDVDKKPDADKKPSTDVDKKPIAKKSTISIEVRKPENAENRPKTVKVFNARMRSTGLEEEAKPPPAKVIPARKALPAKRVSPPPPSVGKVIAAPPPEKKLKLLQGDLLTTETEQQSRPGGVKLIAPKPKPIGLQECGLFMDAISAAAKKEPKKRKRSTGKDELTSPSGKTLTSPPPSPLVTSPSVKPTAASLKISAPKFYNDTLENTESETKDADEKKESSDDDEPLSKMKKDATIKTCEDEMDLKHLPPIPTDPNYMNVQNKKKGGVLVYNKRTGPKKSVQWKKDSELTSVRLFELDETERVNVTRNFVDMKQFDMNYEREGLQLSRKLPNDDTMEVQTLWRAPKLLTLAADLAVKGKNSKEKDIQYAREKVILQAIYFNKATIPDTATEPDIEHHPVKDPVIIPLDDSSGNASNVKDLSAVPWPEPRGELPQPTVPNAFPPFAAMPPNNFAFMDGAMPAAPPIPPMPGMNGFMPPFINQQMMPGPWASGDVMNGMPPPEMFNGMTAMGPVPMGMFPPNGPPPDAFNMNGPFQGNFFPSGPPNGMFNNDFNKGGFRGRGGGAGGGGGFNNNVGYRSNRPKMICKHFQRNGTCRKGNECRFLHPT